MSHAYHRGGTHPARVRVYAVAKAVTPARRLDATQTRDMMLSAVLRRNTRVSVAGRTRVQARNACRRAPMRAVRLRACDGAARARRARDAQRVPFLPDAVPVPSAFTNVALRRVDER